MVRRMGRGESGQAIILAVILLVLMAIMGATFVALLSHTMSTTSRTGDVLAAQEAADSGIAYVHQMFLDSPKGADFRMTWPVNVADLDPLGPTAVNYYTDEEIQRGLHLERFVKIGSPAETGDPTASTPLRLRGATGEVQRGRAMVKIEYVPSDFPSAGGVPSTMPVFNGAPLSRFIRVVSAGSAPEAPGVFRLAVAYIPLLITDQLISITDSGHSDQAQPLGGPTVIDYDGDGMISDFDTPPNGLQATDELVSPAYCGGVFSNTGIAWYGGADTAGVGPAVMGIRLNQNPVVDSRAAAALFGDRIAAAGPFSLNTPPGGVVATVGLYNGGSLIGRLTPSYASMGVPNSTFDPMGGLYVDDMGYLEGWRLLDTFTSQPYIPAAQLRAVNRIEGPRTNRVDVSGQPIIETSVRASGALFQVTAPPPVASDPMPTLPGTWVNTGELGLGTSLYVDNPTDVQSPNVDEMVNEWLRRGPGANAATWYGPFYIPPGAEITFFDHDLHDPASPAAPVYSVGRGAVSLQRPLGNDPAVPDIRIRLFPDAQGRPQLFRIPVNMSSGAPVYDPVTPDQTMPLDANGDGVPDSEAVFDYPQTGIIFVAGNARVRGRLPSLWAMRAWDGGIQPRLDWEYNVTLLSGGNIYVEGNLMRPSDLNPSLPELDTTTNPALTVNSRIALLATGSVVVNGSVLSMRSSSTSAPLVPDARGREGGSHWEIGTGQFINGEFQFAAVDDFTPADGLGGAGDWDGDGELDAVPADLDLFLKFRLKGDRGSQFRLYVNGVNYDFSDVPGVQQYSYLTGRMQTIRVPLRMGGTDIVPINDAPGVPNQFTLAAAATMRAPLEVYGYCLEPRTVGADPTVVIDALPDDPRRPETVGVQMSGLIYGGRPYPMDVVISALMYAQEGKFFIIPGEFFDPSASATDHNGDGIVNRQVYVEDGVTPGVFLPPTDVNGDGVPDLSDVDLDYSGVEDWIESRRFNTRLTLNGAIAASTTADIMAVAAWSDKLSWYDPLRRVRSLPEALQAGAPEWGQVRYVYDPGLRAGRQLFYYYQSAAGRMMARDYRPRFPCLPVSEDIVYAGNVVPPAG